MPSVNVVTLWDDMDQLMRYKLALFSYCVFINKYCLFFLFCHSFEYKIQTRFSSSTRDSHCNIILVSTRVLKLNLHPFC